MNIQNPQLYSPNIPVLIALKKWIQIKTPEVGTLIAIKAANPIAKPGRVFIKKVCTKPTNSHTSDPYLA